MEMIKGIALLLVVLAGFSLFSLKMPKGMKAMGALAGAATASFLVEAFQLYVGGDLLGFEFLKGVGQAAGSMGGVAAGALVPIALGVNPTYAILIGVSVAGYGILPGFLAGYILSFVVPKLEEKIPQGVDLIVIRAYMFDLFGKNRRIVPVTRPGTHDLAVVAIRTIARKGKDLRHIDLVITPRRGIGELHRIAPALVPCREFHQREVREVMPVHIYQSDPHDYCFKSSAISGSRLPRYSIRPSKRHASRKCSRPSALRPSREQAMARRYSVTASLGIVANSSIARSL